ncbi:Predicted ATPase [Desulfocicer vacuolatum DSM 3385]|uniref:Predicted ATPase n=1 Tax=Desulfocicer vacuolatum DSM 3385 TaxID=1121400 RepID=A0A1W2CD02_9BACT|nr:AAA family ATPase [Desulfocicer vacuolatum]SMC82752.1 Predicted ATPase [Desulfocicer vacuolatum DSM 3385]
MNERLVISTINLKKYKNLKFAPDGLNLNDLNILIGPNGSGKSNLLSVVNFISQSTIQGKDQASDLSEFEKAVIELGDSMMIDATLDLPDIVRIECEFSRHHNPDTVYSFILDILVKGREGLSPVIKREILSQPDVKKDKEQPFYFYKAHDLESGKGVVSAYNSPPGGVTYFEKLESIPVNRLLFSTIPELLEKTSLSPEQTPVYEIRRKLADFISGWRFYNANEMNLKDIRESEPKITGHTETYLLPSGENLPSVFDSLCQVDFTFEEIINQELRKILPTSRKIRAVRSGRLRLMIEWHLEGIAHGLHLSDMSDGTVRMLCWAVILLSPKPKTSVFIKVRSRTASIFLKGYLCSIIEKNKKKKSATLPEKYLCYNF